MPTRVLRPWIDSEAVNSLSDAGEVFFVRLIQCADDFGRFYGTPALLKAYLYPLKDKRVADITRWIAECVKAGLIVDYEVAGKRYLEIRKFGQRVRLKTAGKFPPPPDTCRTDAGQMPDTCRTHAGHMPDTCPTHDRQMPDACPTDAGQLSHEKKREAPPPQTPPPEREKESVSTVPAPVGAREGFDDPDFGSLIPEALRTPAFLDKWEEWLRYRRRTRKSVSRIAATRQLKQLAAIGPEAAMATIDRSIENDWQGLFPARVIKLYPAGRKDTSGI